MAWWAREDGKWPFYLLLFHFDRKLKAMNKSAKWSTKRGGGRAMSRRGSGGAQQGGGGAAEKGPEKL